MVAEKPKLAQINTRITNGVECPGCALISPLIRLVSAPIFLVSAFNLLVSASIFDLSADLGEQIGFSCTRLAKAHPSPLIIDLFQALSRISDAR